MKNIQNYIEEAKQAFKIGHLKKEKKEFQCWYEFDGRKPYYKYFAIVCLMPDEALEFFEGTEYFDKVKKEIDYNKYKSFSMYSIWNHGQRPGSANPMFTVNHLSNWDEQDGRGVIEGLYSVYFRKLKRKVSSFKEYEEYATNLFKQYKS